MPRVKVGLFFLGALGAAIVIAVASHTDVFIVLGAVGLVIVLLGFIMSLVGKLRIESDGISGKWGGVLVTRWPD